MKFDHIAPESPRKKNSSQIYADSFGCIPIFTVSLLKKIYKTWRKQNFSINNEIFSTKIRTEKNG